MAPQRAAPMAPCTAPSACRFGSPCRCSTPVPRDTDSMQFFSSQQLLSSKKGLCEHAGEMTRGSAMRHHVLSEHCSSVGGKFPTVLTDGPLKLVPPTDPPSPCGANDSPYSTTHNSGREASGKQPPIHWEGNAGGQRQTVRNCERCGQEFTSGQQSGLAGGAPCEICKCSAEAPLVPLSQPPNQESFFGIPPLGQLSFGFPQASPKPIGQTSPSSLPTIFESEGHQVVTTATTGSPAQFRHALTPLGADVMHASAPSTRYTAMRQLPRSSNSEPGHRRGHGTRSGPSQQQLSPLQPLSSQLSPSLAALLTVLSESEAPRGRPVLAGVLSPGTPRSGIGSGGLCSSNSSSGSSNVNDSTTGMNSTRGEDEAEEAMFPYRKLEVSSSLSALMAILSFDNDPESPPSGSLTGELTRSLSRSLQSVKVELEASLQELELDSSPRQLLRQSSLDSGAFQLTEEPIRRKGSAETSPARSMSTTPMGQSPSASPSASPVRARLSPAHGASSPVLQRRITSHRSSAVRECWNAGPLRNDVAQGGGLRSVTQMIEEEGTAAFYRGFQAAGGTSPASVARSKRSRVGH